jgi:uncharacterized protein (UPF0248 family)
MVFQTLNRLKWQGQLKDAEITILHRGAPGDRKTIPGERITEIRKGYFYFSSGGRETFIPLHRVMEVHYQGKLLWKRSKSLARTGSSDPET